MNKIGAYIAGSINALPNLKKSPKEARPDKLAYS